MGLDSLPPELIIAIASLLPRHDVISLGLRTYNKRLFAACTPMLKRLASAKKFEKRMLESFGSGLYEGGRWPHITEYIYTKLGFDKKFGPYVGDKTVTGKCFEPFTGDLQWLQPSKKWDWNSQVREGGRPKVEDLKTQAAELGVVLPKSFLTWISNGRLMARTSDVIGLAGIDHFRHCRPYIGHELRKCTPRMTDGDAYMVTIYQEHEGPTWSLYLDTGPEKGHCVFRSNLSPDDEDCDHDYEIHPERLEERYGLSAGLKESKIKPAWARKRTAALVECDFEEWLAKVYFGGCYFHALGMNGSKNLGAAEEAYISSNFSSAIARTHS
ncbi:MAG: hypothetical protein M1820_000143 [Bogoriella megaspora]|nr:MAG: hypothetical protein M1820_000143 [Bogoriella megaspora]